MLMDRVQGFIWGHPDEPLLEVIPDGDKERSFDLIIMSDLVFNHSQVRSTLELIRTNCMPMT